MADGVTASDVQTVCTPEDLRATVGSWKAAGLRVGFVPTMGALHDGHLSLVRRARELSDRVVASVFVNPTQFGPGEDFDSYPRSPERDAEMLAEAGCRLLFLPQVETIYPPGGSTFVEVEGPSRDFEGAERPEHFRGVATVVLKLLQLAQPDLAVFGEKDAQQLAVVRRMVCDLHLPVEIIGAPIVREGDGLAMSSRNVYLSAEERRAATVLHRSLEAVRREVDAGQRSAFALSQLVLTVLESEPLGRVDYVAVVDQEGFRPIETLADRSVIAIAVRFGSTRLLDNLHIELG
ncbi:MAG: pantoate--beta-alanine ligase [Thermoanaerobaculia bacterium]|nr:pantoate--beta-alanine ligase [Thermoanaerobaculia bacterium]